MKKLLIFSLIWAAVSAAASNQTSYGVATQMWPEEYGSQRAVIEVSEPGTDCRVVIPWRLKSYPDGDFVVIHNSSGKIVQNRNKGSRDRFSGEFFFQTAEAGEYHLYYLPYTPYRGHGSFRGEYSSWKGSPWRADAPIEGKLLRIESRTPFDSFYPMEVCATPAERNKLEKTADDYLVFLEDRDLPVRMKKSLPLRWIQSGQKEVLHLTAMRNEYYSFQIALAPVAQELKNVRLKFSKLEGSAGEFPPSIFTCFNLEGVDPYGEDFTKEVSIPAGRVQPFWIGTNIPADAAPGDYTTTVTVTPENSKPRNVTIKFTITEPVLTDRGDSEPWKHSRLRWLNSTLGHEKTVTAPYSPVEGELKRNRLYLSVLGRTLTIGPGGFPLEASADGQEVLAQPIRLKLKRRLKELSPVVEGNLELTHRNETRISWKSTTLYEGYDLTVEGWLEFDGYSRYKAVLKSRHGGRLADVSLVIPWNGANAEMMMGMNQKGRSVPALLRQKWIKPQDSFWIGSTRAGMQCELLGASYSGPMLNLYRPDPPPTWYNRGKGGMKLTRKAEGVITEVNTGSRKFYAQESELYQFSLLLTPVKPLDTRAHFSSRYYHHPEITDEDYELGVNVVNIHHANRYNPYINYPFIVPEKTKELVKRIHGRGAKMKIYYTVRELTSLLPELWALRSLGDEILPGGKGGGFTWLQEHLENDYDTEWYAFNGGEDIPDAALLTSGISRWYNYYVEGLKWMLENYGIDGLYMDDVAFDRSMLQRIRRVMESIKPGCLIDLHSNRNFSKGPTIQYMEFFPYIDKLWFGESFNYELMDEENWLVETSGLPFGLMGDMLQDGGNRWRGMVFGMTNRLPWSTDGHTCDPRVIWQQYDRIGMADAEMMGWWEKNPAATTSHKRVKATLYRNPNNGKILLALASWAGAPSRVSVEIDWQQLGLNPSDYKISHPHIDDFQNEADVNLNDIRVKIRPRKGSILYIEPIKEQ